MIKIVIGIMAHGKLLHNSSGSEIGRNGEGKRVNVREMKLTGRGSQQSKYGHSGCFEEQSIFAGITRCQRKGKVFCRTCDAEDRNRSALRAGDGVGCVATGFGGSDRLRRTGDGSGRHCSRGGTSKPKSWSCVSGEDELVKRAGPRIYCSK